MKFSSKKENTVKDIIIEFNQKIPYVIARNYENFPHFKNDLDFFVSVDIKKIILILKKISVKNSWDLLLYCDHYSRSNIIYHQIKAFQFFDFKNNEILKIDFFYSFLLWGNPLVKSNEIIDSKIIHHSNLFFVPNPIIENLFKLLQVHKLISWNADVNKINLYKKYILSNKNNKQIELFNYGKKINFFFISSSIYFLKKNKIRFFIYTINLSKFIYSVLFLIKNPCIFFKNYFNRLIDYYFIFFKSPCGVKLNVSANYKNKKIIKNILNDFVNKNIISSWSLITHNIYLPFSKRKILERQGLLLEWSSSLNSQTIIINKNDSKSLITKKFLKKIIFRHKIICSNDK